MIHSIPFIFLKFSKYDNVWRAWDYSDNSYFETQSLDDAIKQAVEFTKKELVEDGETPAFNVIREFGEHVDVHCGKCGILLFTIKGQICKTFLEGSIRYSCQCGAIPIRFRYAED